MNPIFSYWKDVARRAFRETAFLAWRKMVMSLVLAMVSFSLQWFFGLHRWSDIWKIALTALMAYPVVMLVAFLTNLVRVPAILHGEQSALIAVKSSDILRLEETQQHSVVLKFDFRLHTKPGPHISMDMVSTHGGHNVSIPFIGLTVSNKVERHIEVIAYHLSKFSKSNYARFPSDVVIEPMRSGEVDVTRQLIELVAELRKPNWDKIFGPYQVEVAVECRGEPGEKPIKSDVKIFDLVIDRT